MSAIALIIFGLVGWYVYYCVKNEGGYWIPKILLNTGAFVGFFWCIRFIFPYVYEPFIKSTSVLGQLVKTGIFSIIYMIIYSVFISSPVYKLLIILEEKIKERVGSDPYKRKDKLTPEQEQKLKDIREKFIKKNNLESDE